MDITLEQTEKNYYQQKQIIKLGLKMDIAIVMPNKFKGFIRMDGGMVGQY